MIKRTVVVIVCLAAAVLGAQASSATAQTKAQAQRAGTAITIVKPVDQYQVLKPGWTITNTFYGGSCSEGSEAVIGADRCMVGNSIYDPCWPSVNNRNRYRGSYCPATAWSRRGILIKGHHHPYNDARGRSPLGLRLASGLRCMETEGAGSTYRGKRVSYFCEHSRTWLVGSASKRSRTWTITAITYNKQYRVIAHWTARIGRAWMAVSPYGR